MERKSLTSLCAALCAIGGVNPPENADAPHGELLDYAEKVFDGEKADRIFMYNPDAVAEWVCRKYPQLVSEVADRAEIEVPFGTMMPSVTPVCFGTMYTGATPEVHGIQSYVKPIIKIETLFDVFIKAGKRCAIVSTANDSLSMIFLERKMDYYIYDTVEEVNAKAVELVIEDKYDFMLVYNKDYDAKMHKFGPESVEGLAELRSNSEDFAMFDALINNRWKNHNVFIGFATDHGCHEIDGNCGSHGLDMPEDINILHFYKAKKREV